MKGFALPLSNDHDADRRRMIAETGAFITWALKHPDQAPRLPRRRVDAGGFQTLLTRPGAKAAIASFWQRTLGRAYDRW